MFTIDFRRQACAGRSRICACIADPAGPMEVGHWSAEGVTDWAVYPHMSSGHVYFNDMTGADAALYIARFDRPVAALPEDASLTLRPVLSIRPNPTRGAVTLSLPSATAGTAEIEIIDASGRLVRRLAGHVTFAGILEASWDGRHEGGGLLPTGVYFATAAGGRSAAINPIR